MAKEHAHESSIATYVVVALVLGVITYVEFAIVEFEIAWLSSFWILFWLVLLSIAKFILVIAFFMHLKDDDNLYTGFFGSGIVFAMGTFVVLALLFTLPAAFRFFQAETPAVEPELVEEAAHGEDPGISEDVLTLIETDGYTRPIADILDTPRPKDQRVILLGPALAEELGFTLLPETEPLDAAGDVEGGAEDVAPEGEAADAAVAADAQDPAPSAGEGAEEGADAPPGVDEVAQEDGAPEDAPQEEGAPAAEAAQEDDAPADEAAQEGAADEEQAAAWDEALGEQVYGANCASCHQPTGQGIPGAFPPLAEHMADLYAAEGARDYLINVMLYGLQGQITVGGAPYNGVMPAWPQLSNEQIAAVLNHELTSWGNRDLLQDFQPLTPAEVEEQRGQGLTAQQVLEQREALALP